MIITFGNKTDIFLDQFTQQEMDDFDDLTILRAIDSLAVEIHDNKRKFDLRTLIHNEAGKINSKMVEGIEPPKEETKVEEQPKVEENKNESNS